MAKIAPVTTEVHGERRVDDYHWLREKENPDVRAYLEAENAYTDAVMKPTEGFQQALYAEMLGRIQETDENVPYRRGGFFYYSRTEQGKQYPIYCRRKGSLEAAEEVTLDLNRLAEGKAFMSLGAYQVSDDASLLAYATDDTGFRQYTLFVKDLRTGRARGEGRGEGRARWPGRPTAARSSTRSRRSPRSGSTGCYRHRLGDGRARPRLRGDGRGVQRRRLPHAEPAVRRPRHRQPDHQRGALPAGRGAARRVAARGPAGPRAGVRRRAPRRRLLHPRERHGAATSAW